MITQSPSANQQANRGDTVTIFVGDFKGGSPTTINPP